MEARSVRQASPAQLSSMIDDARVALGARELRVALPACELTAVPHNDDEIIVQGTKQKRLILQEYEENVLPITQIQSLLRRKVRTLTSILIGKSFV